MYRTITAKGPARAICALMAALLISLWGFSALAAPGDADLFVSAYSVDILNDEEDYGYLNSIAVAGDTVYALSSNGIYSWRQGQEKPALIVKRENPTYYFGDDEEDIWTDEYRTWRENYVERLIAHGDEVLAYNYYYHKVGRVTDSGIEWLDIKLDMPKMEVQTGDGYMYTRSVVNMEAMDGRLYVLMSNEDDMKYDQYVLYGFDLATGQRTDYKVENVYGFIPYKDGKLLLTCVQNRDEWPQKVDLNVFDPGADKIELTLYKEAFEDTYSRGALAYDPAKDAIYYAGQGQIYSAASGAPFETVAYAPFSYISFYNKGAMLGSDYYVCQASEGLFIRNVDPAFKAERTLSVAGNWSYEAIELFRKRYPDIPLLVLDKYYNGSEDIAAAITGGESNVDVFNLNGVNGLYELMNKGYTADLSSAEKLVADVDSMYPQIAKAVKDDSGRLMAYPIYFYLSPWRLDRGLWDHFFPGEEPPTTYDGLFDLMERWNADFAADVPEVNVFTVYDGKRELVRSILVQFILENENEFEPVNFQDPQLRALLERVENMDIQEYDWENMTDTQREEISARMNGPQLFGTYSSMFLRPGDLYFDKYKDVDSAYESILPMAISADKPAVMETSLQVHFVNPASQNLDLAISYLECVMETLYAETNYAMHPELMEPVEDPYFERTKKDLAQYRDELVENLKTAPEERKQEIQDAINYYDKWLENEEDHKWLLTADSIERYRELAPQMVVNTRSQYFDYSKEENGMYYLEDQMSRYFDGQLSLDNFLKEMTNRGRMIFLEGM